MLESILNSAIFYMGHRNIVEDHFGNLLSASENWNDEFDSYVEARSHVGVWKILECLEKIKEAKKTR